MLAKINPSLEHWINVRRASLAKAMDSKPSLVIEGCFDALQPCDLEFVEVWVGFSGEVERDLLVKREQFVCVSQQISQPIFSRPKYKFLHRSSSPTLVAGGDEIRTPGPLADAFEIVLFSYSIVPVTARNNNSFPSGTNGSNPVCSTGESAFAVSSSKREERRELRLPPSSLCRLGHSCRDPVGPHVDPHPRRGR